MNRRNLAILLMTLAGLLAGCSLVTTGGSALEGTRWVLVELNGQPPLSGTAPSAEFAADEIKGSAGCNLYFGTYAVDGDKISIRDLASTEMACQDPQGVMDQDQVVLAALASAASYQRDGTRLELLDATGGTVLAFESAPSAP